MNELSKTLAFAGAAALVALLAIVFRPEPFEQPRQRAGERLFADLEDASQADALEITRYDPDQTDAVGLKIRRDGDQWVIASHDDYPADASDAKQRIQDVALKLMDLEVIDVASELTSDHGLFGVVSPEGDAVEEADEEDIGLLVGLADEEGKALARLIVGKRVRNEQSDEVQRFVRKAGEPMVYTAAIDTEDLTSDFADWIEPDILGVESRTIRQVTIKDHNVHLLEARGPGGQSQQIVAYEPRFELTADWDADQSTWKLEGMRQRRGNRMASAKLSEDEQLNAESLDELKRAVGNLKIVDVNSKPQELVEGVTSEKDLVNDPRIQPLLEEKGFYPSQGELLSSDGEVRVQTEEGIEYVLRFGNEAGVVRDDEGEPKLTRYLLVSANVAEEQLAKMAEEEPASTESPLQPPLGAGGQAGDEGEPGSAAEETETPADETSDATNADEEAGGDNDANEAAGGDDEDANAGDESTGDAQKSEAPAENNNAEGGDDADSGDEARDEEDGDDEDSPALNPPATVPPDAEDADNSGAEESGETAEDELAKKRKQAEEKVAELNQKFANWFYVVSEDEYKKIRLGRSDVIQAKQDESFGLDEFENLEDLPPDADGTAPPTP